jgi:hypothetical protein
MFSSYRRQPSVSDLVAYGIAFLVAICGGLLLASVAIIVRGLCLSVLWGWLIVPVFGLAPLSVAAALGLALFLTFLLRGKQKELGWCSLLVESAWALLFGYILRLFI